jgi:hypothetical protein
MTVCEGDSGAGKMDAHPSAHHDEDVFARRFATGEQDFAGRRSRTAQSCSK